MSKLITKEKILKKKRAGAHRFQRRRVDINLQELDGILSSAVEAPISETEADKVKTALHAMAELLTPRPRTTEKTAELFEPATSTPTDTPTDSTEESRPPSPGHGRNGAAAFVGAQTVEVAHSELKAGCACPECQKGKVYLQKEPKVLVRFVGQPPVQATVYKMERLRCNLCGQVFTAQEPEGVGPEKYDETVPSMVAQLKYGSGMPFYRIEALQKKMGVPLPASTQWELVQDAAAHEALIQLAAQGEVLHNDDTSMRVLNIDRPADDKRTGIFTSGVVSSGGEQNKPIALFITGVQHAGENLRDILQHRSKDAGAPMLMCDALSRNVPKFKTPDAIGLLLANCLTHGRRHFVDVSENFPDECRYVLETLGEVYAYDREARESRLNPQERLAFHQEHSKPLMDKLKAWMTAQLEEKKTEPNSGLGLAMKYMLKHWEPLTLFLRKAGAPLDNNICYAASGITNVIPTAGLCRAG